MENKTRWEDSLSEELNNIAFSGSEIEAIINLVATEISAAEQRGYDTAMAEVKQAEPEIAKEILAQQKNNAPEISDNGKRYVGTLEEVHKGNGRYEGRYGLRLVGVNGVFLTTSSASAERAIGCIGKRIEIQYLEKDRMKDILGWGEIS